MESKILTLFAYDSQLTFSQIKEKLKIRSNLLSYWLNKLIKMQILDKVDNLYTLSEKSEHLVPYLSENKSTLPVILILIRDKNKVFLYKRAKRPYKGMLSLPGGRLLIGESIERGAKRIMQTKFNIAIEKTRINSINLEHVTKKKRTIYSFLLILVKAETKDSILLENIYKVKNKIIKSDYNLIKSANDEEIEIKTIFSDYK